MHLGEERRMALELTLRWQETQRRLLEELLRLETIRDEAGGLQAVRELLDEAGRDPIDVDQILEALGVSSVRERLEDLRHDIGTLRAMLER